MIFKKKLLKHIKYIKYSGCYFRVYYSIFMVLDDIDIITKEVFI